MKLADLAKHVPTRTAEIFLGADANCTELVGRARTALARYAAEKGLDAAELCFVATGSVGRCEALEASDLDLLPVLHHDEVRSTYEPHDRPIRAELTEVLGVHVSQGADLTKLVSLTELTDQESIGGETDCDPALTKRVLVLTEGRQLYGDLALDVVRGQILDAYAGQDRTSGRHVLSFCNDVARYYRTLCINYKAKVDVHAKDWATRNMKLRHSRKFWYFATMLAVVAVSERHHYEDSNEEYMKALLLELGMPPAMRLVSAAESLGVKPVGDVLERYGWFLEFMAAPERREALSAVEHAKRYDINPANPFPGMKANSDLLHVAMMRLVDELPPRAGDKLYSWFLL